jgi:hypothetical protein
LALPERTGLFMDVPFPTALFLVCRTVGRTAAMLARAGIDPPLATRTRVSLMYIKTSRAVSWTRAETRRKSFQAKHCFDLDQLLCEVPRE